MGYRRVLMSLSLVSICIDLVFLFVYNKAFISNFIAVILLLCAVY